MNKDEIIEALQSCKDCLVCLKVCDTYLATENKLQSPNGRLKIADKIFSGVEISEDERFGMFTCTLCSLCDLACTQSIPISNIIHEAKIEIANTDKGTYEIHDKIINGILKKDNSVNGDPAERLDWLPEKYRSVENFEMEQSDTLLFLGCMSSFKVKESASSSYEILKQTGYNFKILENEPCCGEYIYSAGKLNLAKSIFGENYKLFKENGIKNLIVTCAGCLYAFNNVYPKYIPNWDIKVKHIIQVIYELEKEGKLNFTKEADSVFYHDACRMGRKIKNMDIYKEPRELLKLCGAKILELEKNNSESPCCGAGSGIRGVA
ncbi:MAG: hypothetical protein GF353_22520, partial [Candidatus Lokiarchaeota archaeon]|nr:hypothetical protein [Candidatus Lokiarchaeota archaeon]